MPATVRSNTFLRLYQGTSRLKASVSSHRHLAAETICRAIDHVPSIEVSSYRALIRTVGKFKYENDTSILLRGQARCHKSMKASIYRASPVPSDTTMDSFLGDYRGALGIDLLPEEGVATEPLLQHYGIATRWLDVVDSVPHALFFATYQMVRSASRTGMFTFIPSAEKYGFIYLIDVGNQVPVAIAGQNVSGFTQGGEIQMADLRRLKPSLALRPHAQHGLLIRHTGPDADFWPHIVARIAIRPREARCWISSRAFEPCELFPNRHWDGVYGNFCSLRMHRFLSGQNHLPPALCNIHRFDFHDD